MLLINVSVLDVQDLSSTMIKKKTFLITVGKHAGQLIDKDQETIFHWVSIISEGYQWVYSHG